MRIHLNSLKEMQERSVIEIASLREETLSLISQRDLAEQEVLMVWMIENFCDEERENYEGQIIMVEKVIEDREPKLDDRDAYWQYSQFKKS